MNAFACNRAEGEAAVGLNRGLDTEIGPRARLHLIPTRELIYVEEQGVVKDKALQIRDGNQLVVSLTRPRDNLSHWLDHKGSAVRIGDEGVAVIKAHSGEIPGECIRGAAGSPFLEG